MTNQTTRVLELLKRFNDGKKVCIEALQNDMLWEGKSVKTIRRDLDVIKEVFPNSFELVRGGESGCYKAITKDAFDNFMNKDTLALMVRAFSIVQYNELFDSLEIDSVDKKLIENKINEFKNIYAFKSKPFENKLNNKEIYSTLEKAIYRKRKLTMRYEVKGEERPFEIKPYKILFMNENFYLISEVEGQKFRVKISRISKIKSLIMDSESFYHHAEINRFIGQMQTPLAIYSEGYEEKLIKVMLEVDVSKAEHFKSKKHLASQNIEEEKSNGKLILSFQVTQNMEIEELIKKWIPYIRVIEPMGLKKKIEAKLREYLE
ncbi:MAG: WYL domain-containing protein [Sulfurovum sp.]|nr:WYL domain-containing protein [Sulfurovum sp.]